MKHFENLWEDAESLDTNLNKEEILDEIKGIISDYDRNIKCKFSPETHKELSSRNFGRILFYIAQLSKFENINVYETLMKEIEIQKIELLDKDH